MLISMFLSPGTVDPSAQLYRGQGRVQTVLLLCAALCVPVMLIGKPYYVWREMKERQRAGYVGLIDGERPINHREDGSLLNEGDAMDGDEHPTHGSVAEDADDNSEVHEQHDFGEVVIHQVIHTIEFCLGCISHTALYLRLWALSLAHSQLSEVLWDSALAGWLGPTSIFGWIMLVCMGCFWFSLTVGGLCVIEGLSAFLHAL
ncbi:vacuolar H[+] ATPase subunit 100-2 [Mycena crocata]|nr:vacuolar H[+] ATPase subunit 100-2 [Mycena crocata]